MALIAAQRFDTGAIGKIERTPQGGMRIFATPTRTGVFLYQMPDGSFRREYRSPEEVFSPDSLASLRNAPITDLHPEENGTGVAITPSNYRKFTVGHVGEDIRREGDHVAAWCVIQDAAEISLIENREREETSCGYSCALEMIPGTTPEGEKYDASQKNIRYNHVALGPRDWGRAGPTARLHLDSKAGVQMEIETIDGKDYKVGSAEWAAAKAKQTQALRAKLEAEKTRADNAEKALSNKATAEAIKAKIRLVSDCQKLATIKGRKFDADAALEAPEGDVLLEAIKMMDPEFDGSNKSPDYIKGYFACLLKTSMAKPAPSSTDEKPPEMQGNPAPEEKKPDPTKTDGKRTIFGARAGDQATQRQDQNVSSADKAREEMNAKNRDAWKTPLTGARK